MSDRTLVALYRRVLIGLAGATALGACVELAMLRHWKKPTQLVPWVLLAVVLAAAGLLWTHRSVVTVRAARVVGVVGVVGALGAAVGVWEHIESNMETAPLSAAWSATWDSLPASAQFLQAATGGAGGAPPLAPGFLALSGICLTLATLGDGWSTLRA